MVNSPAVISQVYGGGGNSGAPFTHDFVEIFNRSTGPVSLAGWSLQYASATGTGNFGATTTQITELPSVTLAPGQYYLVQQAGGTTGAPLPTPDDVDSTPINLAGTAGKLALVSTATPLGCNGGSTPCSPAMLAQIVDLIGYGGANFFEGAAAPTLSNTTAALRGSGGCTDTNNNSSDFTAGNPAPRNSAAPVNNCGITMLSGTGTATPSSVGASGTTLLTVTVTPATGPASTGITVQANLTAIGGSATQAFADNGAAGDAVAGDNIFSFNAVVSSGTTPGAKVLAFNIADAQARTANGNINLTVTAPVVITSIHNVQGPGNTSPLEGQTVTVRGVVTRVRGNSFYLQTKAGLEDSNPATSEGIVVFTGSGNVPAVAVLGNEIEVTGVVDEFVSASFPSYTAPSGSATLTELVAPLSYSGVLSTGNTITPQVIDFSVLSPTAGTNLDRWSQLERFEGMLVTLSNFRVTQNTGSQTVFGTLSSAPIPYREAGVQANKLATGTPATVPVYDANPEVIRVEGNGLSGGSASFNLPFGSTISSITGVIEYSTSDGIYSLRTNAAGVGTQTPVTLVATPLPMPLPTDFTVATTNVEFFSAAS
jgi:predicted extracellular nuclease